MATRKKLRHALAASVAEGIYSATFTTLFLNTSNNQLISSSAAEIYLLGLNVYEHYHSSLRILKRYLRPSLCISIPLC